jgi:hypothetical protein
MASLWYLLYSAASGSQHCSYLRMAFLMRGPEDNSLWWSTSLKKIICRFAHSIKSTLTVILSSSKRGRVGEFELDILSTFDRVPIVNCYVSDLSTFFIFISWCVLWSTTVQMKNSRGRWGTGITTHYNLKINQHHIIRHYHKILTGYDIQVYHYHDLVVTWTQESVKNLVLFYKVRWHTCHNVDIYTPFNSGVRFMCSFKELFYSFQVVFPSHNTPLHV